MKNQKLKDCRKRLAFKKQEMNKFLLEAGSFLLVKKCFKQEKTNINKAVNRCVLTNNSRSVFRSFKISRHVLRSLGSNGSIPGVKKVSW